MRHQKRISLSFVFFPHFAALNLKILLVFSAIFSYMIETHMKISRGPIDENAWDANYDVVNLQIALCYSIHR